MKKAVVIVGSGTSVESGAPSFKDFNKKILSIYVDQPDLLSDDAIWSSYINTLEHIDAYEGSNIEEVFSFAYLDTQLSNKGFELVNDIQTVIGNVICLSLNPSFKYPKSHTIRNQVDFLKKLQKSYKDFCIISLNWDVLFDKAFIALNPEDNSGNPPSFCPVNYGFEAVYKGLSSLVGRGTLLLKPHGSMNWKYCTKCKNIYIGENENEDFFNTTKTARCPHHSDVFLRNMIIPPVHSKLATFEKNETSLFSVFRKIWKQMHDKINTSDIIFIIGYSFPKTDTEFLSFFKKAVYENIRKRSSYLEPLSIVVVDPNPNPLVERLVEEFKKHVSDGIILENQSSKKVVKENSIKISWLKIKFSQFVQDFIKFGF